MTELGEGPCPPLEPPPAGGASRVAKERESVWQYPRPPRVEPSTELVQVCFNGVLLAESRRACRVLETSHPPVYYLPPEDVWQQALWPNRRRTFCEYKGVASYFDVTVGERVAAAAVWCYPEPVQAFESIRGYLAFYPVAMDGCFVDGERVTAQPGDFYGGWITSAITGPFKGAPGAR